MQTKTIYDLQKTLLFKYQDTLPDLPLPQLSQTISQYLQCVRLFAKGNEFIETKRLCQDFEEGIGKILQSRLKSKQKKQRNWLFDSFNKASYLEIKLPLPFFSNLLSTFKEDVPLCSLNDIQATATNIFLAFSHLFSHVLDNKVQQHKINNNYLCSQLFHNFFNTCRIPSLQCDYLKTYNYMECNHGIVLCRSKFYEIRLFDQDNQVLPEAIIKRQIHQILEASSKIKNQYPVGVLTSLERNKWAQIRNKMIENNTNKLSLEKIQSALIFLCLDPEQFPQTIPERKKSIYFGKKGENRFFDKSLQFIVDGNGKFGQVNEHCALDGYHVVYFLNKAVQIFSDLDKKQESHNNLSSYLNLSPKQLEFDLQQEIKAKILLALKFVQAQSKKQIDVYDQYKGFGAKQCQYFKISVDSLCFLASQLSYFKMYSQIPMIFKPVTSRRFRYGRMDTIRSPTPSSQQFLESMSSDTPFQKKYQLLQKVLKEQKAQVYKVINGKGMHNHLMALVRSLKQGEQCELLQNYTFRRIKQFNVQITNITLNMLADAYFPDDNQTICISFILRQNSIVFHLNSLLPDVSRFYEYMKQSLNQLFDLLQEANILKSKL